MSFSAKVFNDVQLLLQRICNHPFNAALCNGSLSKDKFIYYIQQDSLYLVDFARALALLAGRFTSPEKIALLLELSQGALLAERGLHEYYFHEFNIAPSQEKGFACLAYTSYLVERAATANLAEAMAALLPCFWIYAEVGKYIISKAIMPNPYAKWIETYSGDDFKQAVDKAIELTDELAALSGETERSSMYKAFMTASHLEYCFWDDAENINNHMK